MVIVVNNFVHKDERRTHKRTNILYHVEHGLGTCACKFLKFKLAIIYKIDLCYSTEIPCKFWHFSLVLLMQQTFQD